MIIVSVVKKRMYVKLELNCLYCGNMWVEEFFIKPNKFVCKVCLDSNIKVKEYENMDIFGYKTTEGDVD